MITAKQVYDALKAELDHPQGYISPDPMTLDSVTVDGVISCGDIAEYLNKQVSGNFDPKPGGTGYGVSDR